MKKAEIKSLTNNALIVEYVKTFAEFETNFVLGRGTKQLWKHLQNLEPELVSRGILTSEDVKRLNM